MDNAVIGGVVVAIAVVAIGAYFTLGSGGKAQSALEQSKNEWMFLKLVKKTVISPNTAIYQLALPKETQSLGLPIGQHVQVAATIDGKEHTRSYTPISSDDDKGVIDLLIKSYPTGNVSKYFAELKIGDSVKIRGPKGNFKYRSNLVSEIGMVAKASPFEKLQIAGGTGITPMLQIIKASLKDSNDNTKLKLIFANVTEEDILLKSELDALQANHDRFKVYYVLNKIPAGWTGGEGFVTKDMIAQHCPKPGQSKILLCGPPPMIKAMSEYCEALGFAKVKLISFC
ncbi:NADH-cytochrome b5 reductase [Blyttiomyces sp. JEL0837]|nr:NADH-cytochrome b5 reductase [Blyttiomyces sp. JEL0837]